MSCKQNISIFNLKSDFLISYRKLKLVSTLENPNLKFLGIF